MGTMNIQIGPRYGHYAKFVRCKGQIYTIGRAYSNDLVLTDHYVAAEQLRLRESNMEWFLDILDTTNPVLVNGQPVKNSQIKIQSGDKVMIGRTVLRFYANDHQIEETRKLLVTNWLVDGHWRTILPAIMLFLVGLAVAFSEYLQTSTMIKWQDLASEALLGVFLTVCWAAIWSIVGRVLRHQPQFYVQLSVTAGVYLLAIIGEHVFEPLEYMSNSALIGDVISWLFTLFIITLLLKLNLSIATNLHKSTSVAFFVACFSFAFFFGIYELEKEEFEWEPSYSQVLKPPMFKIHSDLSVDDYLNESESLFENLQAERKQSDK